MAAKDHHQYTNVNLMDLLNSKELCEYINDHNRIKRSISLWQRYQNLLKRSQNIPMLDADSIAALLQLLKRWTHIISKKTESPQQESNDELITFIERAREQIRQWLGGVHKLKFIGTNWTELFDELRFDIFTCTLCKQ